MFKAKVSPILTRYCKTIGTAHPLSLSYELVALYHSLSPRGFSAAINSVHGRKALKRSSSKKLSDSIRDTREILGMTSRVVLYKQRAYPK